MIKPLRDMIVAVPVAAADTRQVGLLVMPDNTLQNLRTHYKAVVLFSGPKAKDTVPPGTIVHVSESWGEQFIYRNRKVWIGRIRDINGVVEGEALVDTNKYLD
jgi:co-chaperonin GroES (HSP10)